MMELAQGSHRLMFLGTILDEEFQPIGTCFQVADQVLVTAYHVIRDATGNHGTSVVWVKPIHAPSGDPFRATVVAADEPHDLAVLRSERSFKASIPHLAYSDMQPANTKLALLGFGRMPEGTTESEFSYLPSSGRWEGTAEKSTGLVLAIAEASGVALGMSGCPILREGDQAVVGVLSGRYNSMDTWHQHPRARQSRSTIRLRWPACPGV
jgi:hypothetical protein